MITIINRGEKKNYKTIRGAQKRIKSEKYTVEEIAIIDEYGKKHIIDEDKLSKM